MTGNTLKVGMTFTRTVEVDRARTISFLGEELRVYATPQLVNDIEEACLDLLLDHVGDGENSVGAAIDIRHTGATLQGMAVQIEVRVARVEGRTVTFEVAARDAFEQICDGTHARVVVNVEKLRQRVAAKARNAAGKALA
ncbi:thioesterase superfamily protein [Paraburkholderia sp. BL8N3]|nr:thioesterase family protein [Paraburkholderia sp. BL8N3]TCK36582.1 thioesterase superfamily protein [Paraburkholderia sp. BL8N3]